LCLACGFVSYPRLEAEQGNTIHERQKSA
jgi:hypothetical protein